MEFIIIMLGVCIPVLTVGFILVAKEIKEEKLKKEQNLQAA